MLLILWWFFFIIIICIENKENEIKKTLNYSIKVNDNKLKEKINSTEEKRNLEEEKYEPIKIIVDYNCLNNQLKHEKYKEYLIIIKKSLDLAKETLEKLIKVKKKKINFSNIILDTIFDECYNSTLISDNIDADLIFFVRAYERGDPFRKFMSNINMYESQDNGRPVVGTLIINDEYEINIEDEKSLLQIYSTIILHEFTHILGFRKDILEKNHFLKWENLSNRINSTIKENKLLISSEKVLEKAKLYYGCNNIRGLEIKTTDSDFCDQNLHWEERILLGEYMTAELYYPDQYISEFTLALLEDLGWYEVNYYTGGLMRFGKNKGCEFLTNDCVEIKEGNAFSVFYNEFCSYDSFSTCSSGRQSRGYCYNRIYKNDVDESYRRNNWNFGYGMKNVEYCPVSLETKNNNNNYYIGNCKIGKNSFGGELGLNSNYNDFSELFGEQNGDNSFCVLSSIKRTNTDIGLYDKLVRPTCHSMNCSDKSLTITLYSNNIDNIEYIVCPRKGGMIKIGGDNVNYTNYTGYLFCPDYNLICTGYVMCNNLFDCVNNQSLKQIPSYDYSINYIPSEINEKEKNIDNLDQDYIIEGFEESDNGICPQNCSQCLSYNRCTLCGNNNNKGIKTQVYYIGEVDDERSHINCSSIEPSGGYYKKTKYIDHIHFFRCLENCNVCQSPDTCEQCLPTHKIDNTGSCVDRIPFCLEYNESFYIEHDKDNGGGKGYIECIHCNNDDKYFCENMNKNICKFIENYSNKTYYKMEKNQKYSCIQKCDIKFPNCIECTYDTCKICKKEYFVNKTTGHCQERIPHCNKYDLSTLFTDSDTNGGGDGYKECKECDNNSNYFCINNNKTICEYIEPNNLQYYFNQTDDPYSCIKKCSLEFDYCSKCNKSRCIDCVVDFKKDGTCYKPIENCLEYKKHQDNNDDYIECIKCDQNNNYYCINNNRNLCEKIDYINYYYPIEDDDSSCMKKCEETFQECLICNRSYCFQCTENYVVSNKNKTKCLFAIIPPDDDSCKVLIHEIDKDINNLNLAYFIDYYFSNTLPYTKHIDHFVNINYTVTMFLYSECTEDLLNQGYYKIDSNDLTNEMYNKAGIESNELLFSIFVTYNYQNHYRFYNIYTQYINETEICPNCLEIPFIITNKYTNKINITLGPIVSNLIELEKVDIFSKDSNIFVDSCENVTLNGVDIPFNERLFYLYLHNYSKQIVCTGIDCEIEEINTEESISTCKCKMGNKFEDILKPIEFENYKDEDFDSKTSLIDNFGIIKCAKNGFNKKNILINGGFFITVVAIIFELGLYCYYCIASKVINFEKIANPPSKIKTKIFLFDEWKDNQDNTPISLIEPNLDLIQSRDEDDENLLEIDLSFSNKIDSSNCSMDTHIDKKRNKEKTQNNKKISEKNGRKILVLLPNKIKEKHRNNDTISEISDNELFPLDKAKKKNKIKFCKIYWFVLSIKQHIINFFSSVKCCKITESFIPLPIRIIKSIFMIILALLMNILFLNQNYFSKKFKYFNEEYKLISIKTDEYTVLSEEISEDDIPKSKLWIYAFSHTYVNAIIVFVILLIIQFIIGIVFFSLRKSVLDVIKKNDLDGVQDLVLKTRIKYISFFIITVVLLIVFMLCFVGFGGAYSGGFIDYFAPGIISLIILEIFPFLWSLILALFRYIGIKKEKKCFYEFSQFFIF